MGEMEASFTGKNMLNLQKNHIQFPSSHEVCYEQSGLCTSGPVFGHKYVVKNYVGLGSSFILRLAP